MQIDPLAQFRLDGRVVLVTGATSGLGERFARVAAAAGARVAIAGRRADRLAALTDELADSHALPGDLAEPAAPEALVDEVIDHYGRLDVLINNAGVSTTASVTEMSPEEFATELRIDLVVPYALARRAGTWMTEHDQPGSIINLGSILGAVAGGRLRVPAYTAAKAGLHNLTRELASQWARKGVRVNALAPGWFVTEMNSDMLATEGGRSYIDAGTPMGRQGEDHELDGALLFLASDASSFVTGHVLYVDGGWTAI